MIRLFKKKKKLLCEGCDVALQQRKITMSSDVVDYYGTWAQKEVDRANIKGLVNFYCSSCEIPNFNTLEGILKQRMEEAKEYEEHRKKCWDNQIYVREWKQYDEQTRQRAMRQAIAHCGEGSNNGNYTVEQNIEWFSAIQPLKYQKLLLDKVLTGKTKSAGDRIETYINSFDPNDWSTDLYN